MACKRLPDRSRSAPPRVLGAAVAHLLDKQGVAGSNPVGPTILEREHDESIEHKGPRP
jgi:hypothetical protein